MPDHSASPRTAVLFRMVMASHTCQYGSSSVPLGFIPLTENLMLVGMAIWVAAGAFSPAGHPL